MPAGGSMSAQPQQNRYIPPRQMNPVPVMSMSGGTSRKPKKGIIIGGILIVVALALGIAAVVLMPKGDSSNNLATENTDFYKYANYLLYGKSNANADLGAYDENANYAVVTAFDEGNTSYFDTLRDFWNGFYKRVAEDDNISETSTLRGEVDWQNELMDFVEKYAKTDEWDDEKLLEIYLQNGFESANNVIENNYDNLKNTIYERGSSYVDDLINNGKVTLDLYSAYNNYGCIKDGSIDDACIENNMENLDGAVVNYFERIVDSDTTILEDTLNDMAKNCFDILMSLKGGNG